MRVLFFGTPEFAMPILRALAGSAHAVAAVVTGPDRPRGRGLTRVEASPVAREAERLGLPVRKPPKPSDTDFLAWARALAPDAIALSAYGHLIPGALLALPPRGPWNVHPSLLPRWRGAAPVHRALLAGDAETGVAIMRMTAKLDAGPVALLERTPIGPRETRGALEQRLAEMGARLLVRALDLLAAGELPVRPQAEEGATYASVVPAAEAELRWERPAGELDRIIRALAPSPGAHARIGEERVKVLEAEPADGRAAPGTLLAGAWDGGVRVACGEGALDVRRVQPAGKSPMAMDAFVRGRRLKAGMSLLAAAVPT